MTTEPYEEHTDGGPEAAASGRRSGEPPVAHGFADPTAGMVLHRVLARSARTFLLNDPGDEPEDGGRRAGAVHALALAMGPRPLWGLTDLEALTGTSRREDRTERIHQARVSMRRIRSNLRTYRLLLDPAWGTALRAELSWYGNELGRSRDLEILAGVVSERGPEVLAPDEVARLLSLIDWKRDEVERVISVEQAGPRRFRLTGEMMTLWDGPEFKAKADRGATDVLPPMLHRAWHDLRGAGRRARRDPTDVHLHQLRIRLKDMRYGAETLASVEGGKARRTAKAAERLQSKLGDHHDTVFSIQWLDALAGEHSDLADAAARLAVVQRDVAADTRKGWRHDLKDVERRWRSWQG